MPLVNSLTWSNAVNTAAELRWHRQWYVMGKLQKIKSWFGSGGIRYNIFLHVPNTARAGRASRRVERAGKNRFWALNPSVLATDIYINFNQITSSNKFVSEIFLAYLLSPRGCSSLAVINAGMTGSKWYHADLVIRKKKCARNMTTLYHSNESQGVVTVHHHMI